MIKKIPNSPIYVDFHLNLNIDITSLVIENVNTINNIKEHK